MTKRRKTGMTKRCVRCDEPISDSEYKKNEGLCNDCRKQAHEDGLDISGTDLVNWEEDLED